MEKVSELVKMFPKIRVSKSDDSMVVTNDINLLPEEVLIEIFDRLDIRSRIAVRRTCQRWQEIIYTDSRFAKHHQLSFDNGVVLEIGQEPVSLFIESDRKFGILRLGDVKFGQNLDAFWAKMAKTVKHLIIKEFSPYSIRSYFVAEIIAKFTRLQVLEIEEYHVVREIIRIERKLSPYLCKWDSVEILKIGDLRIEPENYEFFEIMMPKLREIHFGTYEHQAEEFLKKYATKLKRINVGNSIYTLERIRAHPEFQLTHLEVMLDNITQNETFTEFINNHPSLTSVNVVSRNFPRENIPKMEKLTLDLVSVINSFAPLQLFPDLRELHVKLSNYDFNCFFGHEVISRPNLERLHLCNFSIGDCQKCNECMFQSFPNLKSYVNESCFVSSAEIVQLISKYSPKLEHFKNKCFVTENFCMNNSLLKWTEMKNLRSCYLNPVGAVSQFLLIFDDIKSINSEKKNELKW